MNQRFDLAFAKGTKKECGTEIGPWKMHRNERRIFVYRGMELTPTYTFRRMGVGRDWKCDDGKTYSSVASIMKFLRDQVS